MTLFLCLFGITLATGYVSWIAAYTETIEDINPALVGTGMAVEGFIIRMVVVLPALAISFVVKDSLDGTQWATWWWVCIAGLVVFIPTIFMVSGQWRPAPLPAALRSSEPSSDLSIEGA
jgi:hypothetical protein